MPGSLDKWQGCDDNGEFNDQILNREQAWSGILHASSHLWLWRRKDGEIQILLQKRAETKETWPGYWDISAAGHVDFGESTAQAAVREAAEEIGADFSAESLSLLFVFRQYIEDESSGRIENEFQWVYGRNIETDSNFNFRFTDREVSSLKWVGLEELRTMIDKQSDEQIVPQGHAYFTNLLEMLSRQLRGA